MGLGSRAYVCMYVCVHTGLGPPGTNGVEGERKL